MVTEMTVGKVAVPQSDRELLTFKLERNYYQPGSQKITSSPFNERRLRAKRITRCIEAHDSLSKIDLVYYRVWHPEFPPTLTLSMVEAPRNLFPETGT